MATVRPDIEIVRGDTESITFTLERDGTPVNLTGTTVFFTAKSGLDDVDASAAIAISVTSHSDPTNGITIIPLSSTNTDITPGEYFYDIQVKDGATITSIPYRKLEILTDVTRRTT